MAKTINWIREEEATAILGYKKESLRILCRNEKRKRLPIRSIKLNFKTFLYSKADIEAYINSRVA
jgi:hypothetical protein